MAVPIINILLVDNYDSFTYNIAHSIRNIPGSNLQIIEAGRLDPDFIDSFDKIIFSPGPDCPGPGNIMAHILKKHECKKSILGICLGLQAIYLYYGGKLKQLEIVNHGKKIQITKCNNKSVLLHSAPDIFEAGLYHSWTADSDFMPESLEVTAISDDGLIMGIRHKTFNVEAVQFHPESIMTPVGAKILHHWIHH